MCRAEPRGEAFQSQHRRRTISRSQSGCSGPYQILQVSEVHLTLAANTVRREDNGDESSISQDGSWLQAGFLQGLLFWVRICQKWHSLPGARNNEWITGTRLNPV